MSLFNRGLTRDELPGEVERLRGDRDEGHAGIKSLAGREWDACIDVSGLTARQVRASAELLRENVARYVYICAISVYGDPAQGPVDESQPRMSPADEGVTEVNAETYGRLKVTCENIVQELFDGRCALLRPQIVAGPYDPFDRFSYWVRRAGQGGEMLAPGDGSDYLQTIDAGDLARLRAACAKPGLPECSISPDLGSRGQILCSSWEPKESFGCRRRSSRLPASRSSSCRSIDPPAAGGAA